ncbi:hypothetical protein [Fulvivirga lutea]|uniref:Uncharacterized protein n=1 Tax=Fulvivirga lutea TaxID=2810512 RepID=A0A974WDR7_9BACT|nr:hypothetical protein [Fulvivirga lutea]QSE96283.1 hypothetical protein JR347_11760 [Fulvivirga lutea]
MRLVLIATFLFFSVLSGYAQKIKYKDLFFLLDTENYKDGEPLLKQYLSDPKNADEGNPNLQMAFIYHKKADQTDILLDTDDYIAYADSALSFYAKAKQFIDEKEVKKNDEYYQAYQRRDIRTGKFGIKLADVQFDIENKVNALNERKAQVQELQIYYTKTKDNYQDAQSAFKKIKDDYPTEKILFLRADEDLLERVENTSNSAKLALQNFASFESTIKKIDKPGYRPALHLTDILEYEKDGESLLMLTDDNVLFWDYPKWAESVQKGYKEVVIPMRMELIEYDQHLNDLKAKVLTDSMSLADQVKPLVGVLAKIREYDSDPLPEHIFKYKIAEINNESFKMSNLYYRDSSNIDYQLKVAKTKFGYVKEMDSLVNLLISRDLKEDKLNYSSYIEKKYNDIVGLETYIKEQLDHVIIAKKIAQDEIDNLAERSRWLIGENDSIPLFMEVNRGLSKYVPLVVDKKFTSGFYFSGKTAAEGYFALIDPSKTQKLKAVFKIDNDHFSKQNLEVTKAYFTAEEAGHYYYVLFTVQLPEQEEYAATVAKIYTSDGLAWVKNITLATAPLDLIINPNTDDLIINYDKANYYGGKEIADRLVLTKKGEVKQ